jgi:hypothetical protein
MLLIYIEFKEHLGHQSSYFGVTKVAYAAFVGMVKALGVVESECAFFDAVSHLLVGFAEGYTLVHQFIHRLYTE